MRGARSKGIQPYRSDGIALQEQRYMVFSLFWLSLGHQKFVIGPLSFHISPLASQSSSTILFFLLNKMFSSCLTLECPSIISRSFWDLDQLYRPKQKLLVCWDWILVFPNPTWWTFFLWDVSAAVIWIICISQVMFFSLFLKAFKWRFLKKKTTN